ncbi:hypothetical protein FRC10_005683 [Ceratobasidium sp. 414]|nr:hypothetical protein FRC10_005683 [Ceratobasidium sp. 414]
MSSDSETGKTGELCPCCQKRIGRRQFARHRTGYLQRLEHNLALGQEADSDDSLTPGDAHGGLAPGDADGGLAPGDDNDFALGAQDEVEPAPGGEEVDPAAFLVDLIAELEAAEATVGSPDAMDTAEDGQPLPSPPPELERVHQVRRNPPVTIEDWDDPDDPEPSEASDDDEPAAGEDRDPEYVERAEVPGFNPNDGPDMDDEQFANFLEMRLGDLAEDEWIDFSWPRTKADTN